VFVTTAAAAAAAVQSAVDAGAISARAKPAAAAEKARDLQAALKARGCVEEFTPDPELMADGQVNKTNDSTNNNGCFNSMLSTQRCPRCGVSM
jgi:hypothetical protein